MMNLLPMMNALPILVAVGLLRAAGGPPGPCEGRELSCIELVAGAGFRDAAGHALLRRAPGPFGASVAPDGAPRAMLELTLAGLPSPGGDGAEWVAWATTPLLRPVVRLGGVGNGTWRLGPIELERFVVLVTAERSPGASAPTGPAALRGISPSMALLPHETPALLAAAAGGLRGPGGHAHAAEPDPREPAAHAEPRTSAWRPPPMHPTAPMLPGMEELRPDVAPWLPPEPPASLPVAARSRIVALADGDSLDLVAAPVQRSIKGRPITLYGFNGQVPGPLLQVPQGATITVRFTNHTPLPATIHWHGVRLDNGSDGTPHLTQPPVPPGGSFVYRVRFPDAGIYWYHPHHREDVMQDLLLYGNLRVAEPPGAFGPAHREELLLLDDLLLAENGDLLAYGADAPTHALMGRFGNVLLVNGEPSWERTARRGEVVRFFLTNAASTRTFNLSFGDLPLKVVATDVGRFERESWAESAVIAPAERYVVEVRFDRPGRVPLVNRVRAIDHVYGEIFAEVDTLGWIEVLDEPATPDLADSHTRLRENLDVRAEIDRLRSRFDDPADRTLELDVRVEDLPFPLGPLLALERAWSPPLEWTTTMPMMSWATTGRQVEWVLRDPATGREGMAVDWRFERNAVIKLRIKSRADAFHVMQHPIHIHGQRFLVLAQDGEPNQFLAWKDTVLVPAGTTVDLLLEASNPGRWMLHCHIAEHLETGMHLAFTVTP